MVKLDRVKQFLLKKENSYALLSVNGEYNTSIMRVKLLLTLFIVSAALLPTRVFAASDGIVISEVSMGSEDSASTEFVELYNNSSSAIDISSWSLYYRSATGTSWTKKAAIAPATVVSSHSFYLISTEAGSSTHLTSGMAQSGGVLQLRDSKSLVMDMLGWGSTSLSLGSPSVSAQAGESLYRQYDESSSTMVDSSDNLNDFYITANETPDGLPAVEVEDPQTTTSYPNIIISELYPNPPSDQSESSDEFIELYNPNNFDVDLNGWLLKDASSNTFIVKNKTIAAYSYLVFTSAESKLSLNNTGDVVRLVSPSAQLIDETADYGEAKEGLSWAVVDNSWNWTVSPTPSVSNSSIYVENIVKSVGVTPAIKKATTKKVTTAKPKATKAKKAAASKISASAKTQDPTDSSGPASSALANIWPWLLISLGIGTIGYGIYEYKPEIITAYHKLKNKFTASS